MEKRFGKQRVNDKPTCIYTTSDNLKTQLARVITNTCNYFCLQDVFWLCFVIPFELSEIFQLVYLSLDKTRRFFPSVLFHNYLMYKINFVFYLPFKKKKYSQASQGCRHPSIAGTQGCPLAPPGSSYIMRQRHHAK